MDVPALGILSAVAVSRAADAGGARADVLFDALDDIDARIDAVQAEIAATVARHAEIARMLDDIARDLNVVFPRQGSPAPESPPQARLRRSGYLRRPGRDAPRAESGGVPDTASFRTSAVQEASGSAES